MPSLTSAEALLGRPGQGLPLPGAIKKTLSGYQGQAFIRLGFAYASSAGVHVLLDSLAGLQAWQRSDKHWLFGVHHGVTEPAAIRQALRGSRSRVRLYVGGKNLSRRSLFGSPMFHAKAAVLESRGKGGPAVFLGSANLTSSAMGASARNFEAGSYVKGHAAQLMLRNHLDDWWSMIWQSSVDADDRLIAKYAEFRDEFLSRNPLLIDQADPPPGSHVGGARCLWIEAGAMSGGSRNQVEFNRELAAFFGEVTKISRPVRIKIRDSIWNSRPLTPKTTTFGVDIWRLSLPTLSTGGLDYPSTVLAFERGSDSDGEYFVLRTAHPSSKLHAQWRLKALRTGHAGVTSGQRAYGFFG